jgi:hypothetical protein
MTQNEIFAHLLNLRVFAEREDQQGFSNYARKILISNSPGMENFYNYSDADGHTKKINLKKNFNRRAEGMEDLIRVAYPCFQTGNFNPLFKYVSSLGV